MSIEEDKEYLEKNYTPSAFSTRFSSRDELLNHFVTFSAKKSQKSRLTYNCHLNISYGPTKREKLDIYGDDLPKSAPLFIFIHGGYWQMLDKEDSSFVVSSFIDNGIRVIIPDYELCPNVTLEEITIQTKKCFQWIADYIQKNEIKRVSIAGHSAGAHLLAFAINEEFLKSIGDVQVDAFFLSGVYYLDELRFLNAGNENNLLSITDENYRKLSPQYFDFAYLRNHNIRVHIFAGNFESDRFKLMSEKFAEVPMKEFVINFKFLDVDHFDMIEKLASTDYELTKLIINSLLK